MKCILITGVGHSGTTLMTNVLSKHPNISTPFPILNKLNEYSPLYDLFVASILESPADTDEYSIDKTRLFQILDEYVSHVENNDFFLLKAPVYPLMCLDLFSEYFKGLIVVYTKRDDDKVWESFKRRNEHEIFFSKEGDRPLSRQTQIKKLIFPLREKLQYGDSKEIIYGWMQSCEYRKAQLSKKYKFVEIEMRRLLDAGYFSAVLEEIGLPKSDEEAMLASVIEERL